MFALPVILIFTILLITIQIPIICTLYYSQNYMLKMLSIKLSTNMQSHPLRVRGLKQPNFDTPTRSRQVASFTGAWIETLLMTHLMILNRSHPLRVRGLKHVRCFLVVYLDSVASFTGAWIETSAFNLLMIVCFVASFTGSTRPFFRAFKSSSFQPT